MPVHLVYVRYSEPRDEARLAVVRIRSMLGLRASRTVFVANGQADTERCDDEIAGSNQHREFSGYQEGLDHLRREKELEPADAVLFVNDTCLKHRRFTLYAPALRRASAAWESGLLPAESCWGEIVHLPATIELGGLRLDCHASTYCFALSGRALEKIGNRVDWWDEVVDLVAPMDGEPRWVDGADPWLVRRLNQWLFAPVATGQRWHGRGDGNIARTLPKAHCILSEMFLSAMLVDRGVTLYDPFRAGFLERSRYTLIRAQRKLSWMLHGKLG